ncbi:MAG: 4'-phosphopantetheinyl transferase superfamily protein [Rikenellaceae bacterium]
MSRLFVGDIGVLVQSDDALLEVSDWRAVEECAAESRRSERFAWRVLLRRSLRRMGYGDDVVGADVAYDEHGAPRLVGCEVFIGVAHSRTKVAVAISDRPCAVDLEIVTRNFETVRRRMLTPREEQVLSAIPICIQSLPLAWAAKETLYKLSSEEGLALIDDMEIVGIDAQNCTIECRASRGRFAHQRLTFNYTFDDDHVVVWYL